ncbi:MAG: hypothetical protein IJ385_05935 [Ruminiclostridium sp.]|nr:hypothetical protein [Ruminiclostridium sp.]
MKLKKIMAAFLSVALLTSCTTELEYSVPVVTTSKTEEQSDKEAQQETVVIIPEEKKSADKYEPSDFVIAESEYSETYQLEFNTDAYSYTDGLSGYNGTGFICLGKGDYATITVSVPSSQHYKIGLRICSTGSKVSLITGAKRKIDDAGEEYLDGGSEWGAVYVDESVMFSYFYLDGIYLSKGENEITMKVLSGTAYIDDISIDDSSTVQKLAYAISNSCINKNSTDITKSVKKYLADVYGNKVITGQYCSAGTNTEINAIYMDTGRYSALRCGDLGIFTEYYDGSDKNNEDEINTAIEWWKNGGLVSYSWYWYAPTEKDPHIFTEITEFKLSKAVNDSDIALLDAENLSAYEQTGKISGECYDIIRDIDTVASKIKLLAAQNVPIMFRPLPEAGNGWYWWGSDAESYLWLYKLIYRRFTEYHQLNNIIWVWDGENADFYPGDDYVDIVGMDMYTDYDISGNVRMLDAMRYTIKTKACALTECGTIPNPDYIERDNAYWLWFALWKGDYIINSDGSISYKHCTAKELDYAYNNELYITLDELPDFTRY